MNETTIVLPTSRAIRYEQLVDDNCSSFLPNYLTMSEFISKLCIVDGFKFIDDDTRILLLLEASNFSNFSSLQIERNFFTFTKNSSYIFKFFEELSAELVDISTLGSSDIYAEYEEHISILQELYLRYEQLCNEKKLLDRIFLPKLYKFNFLYAKQLKSVEINVDGYLSNFELELLAHSKEYAQIVINFSATKFNQKMQDRFSSLGIELEHGYRYKISLNDNKILKKEKFNNNKNVICESFSESILQIAFIKKMIYDFVNSGLKPQNIAVILPDEKMAEILKSFDDKSNFNFAMGESFANTFTYKKLNSTAQRIDQDSKENISRLNRVGEEIYLELYKIYYKNENEVDFLAFLEYYKEYITKKDELKIYEEEVYKFKKIYESMKNMSIKSLLHIFLQRLSARTLDDVRGGKITVMGLLETRSVNFDGVIIVDFNDSNVPKKSQKDMFLNSKTREIAGLPTTIDRENLQKHYYNMLINSSKKVAISFIKSSDSTPSRFLKQLSIKDDTQYLENDYTPIIFKNQKKDYFLQQEIVADYSFKDKTLSATSLKTFLTCKRKYFYKYIKKIKNHDIPKDMPKEYEIGLDVHKALKELYTKKPIYTSVDELKKDLEKELDDVCGDSELDKYLIDLQKRKFLPFYENEVKRFNDGWQVKSCEESLNTIFAGAKIAGQIDRIDKRGNEIFVLDYKTGSYPLYTANNVDKATDFQLEFYYLLAGVFSGDIMCGYYDLKESKIVNELFLEEKLSILESNIKDILAHDTHEFSKCEDIKNCMFCEYSIMCQR